MEGEIDMVKEIRIGNILKQGIVVAIRETSFDVRKDGWSEWSSNCVTITPITLTEEWLRKLGLRTDGYSESYSMQIGDDNYSSDGGNIIIINTQKYNDGESYTGDGWLFCTLSTLTSDFDSYGFKTRIKYVHQLQNLYFALTGEELTIKE